MHIDAGATRVRMGARWRQSGARTGYATIQADGLRGRDKAFHIQPLVGLKLQICARAISVDVAANDHILVGANRQGFGVAHAGDRAGDQHAIAPSVLCKVMVGADQRNVFEIGCLVEDGIARHIARVCGIAISFAVVFLGTRGQCHVARGRHRAPQQHLAR